MGFTFDASQVTMSLEKIRARMGVEARRKAVRAGARVIADAMESRAPILDKTTANSTSLDPGDVKAGTNARVAMEDGEPVGLAGPHGKDGRIGKVAYLVEYGHRMVRGGESRMGPDGIFRGKKLADGTYEPAGLVVGDVPAHPFLRPAFESSAEGALEAMGESLGRSMAGEEGE